MWTRCIWLGFESFPTHVEAPLAPFSIRSELAKSTIITKSCGVLSWQPSGGPVVPLSPLPFLPLPFPGPYLWGLYHKDLDGWTLGWASSGNAPRDRRTTTSMQLRWVWFHQGVVQHFLLCFQQVSSKAYDQHPLLAELLHDCNLVVAHVEESRSSTYGLSILVD